MSYKYESFDFKNLLLRLLKKEAIHCSSLIGNNVLKDHPPVEVIDYQQETRHGGYCTSCAYEETIVEITYKDAEGQIYHYTYTEDFAQLIRELERLDA